MCVCVYVCVCVCVCVCVACVLRVCCVCVPCCVCVLGVCVWANFFYYLLFMVSFLFLCLMKTEAHGLYYYDPGIICNGVQPLIPGRALRAVTDVFREVPF